MLSAHDVARELRSCLPEAGDLKIHKLAYYCQGWHLAWTGAPLFTESIHAWTRGPVVADLWHDEKENLSTPARQDLGDRARAVVDYVVERYGRHSGSELARMTHVENPWRDVSESEDNETSESPEITHEALLAWFTQDHEFIDHQRRVSELRKRRGIYGFEGLALSDDLREATTRVLSERA